MRRFEDAHFVRHHFDNQLHWGASGKAITDNKSKYIRLKFSGEYQASGR